MPIVNQLTMKQMDGLIIRKPFASSVQDSGKVTFLMGCLVRGLLYSISREERVSQEAGMGLTVEHGVTMHRA